MIHRHCLEALDKSLRDILSSRTGDSDMKPFGGKTVVLGGDFRQILPVVPGGSKSAIISATICNSKLWEHCEVFTLTQNMHLLQPNLSEQTRQELQLFANWLLDIGNGKINSLLICDDGEGIPVEILASLLVHSTGDPFQFT